MKKFNVRVYGLLINENKEVLVTDEERSAFQFTKFPGGGLEFGEGTIDCLKREFLEELNCEIEIEKLFYLTDFFQQSAFNPNDQLISIYYLVNTTKLKSLNTNQKKQFTAGKENLRWLKISEIQADDMTFPIDKLVVHKLKEI